MPPRGGVHTERPRDLPFGNGWSAPKLRGAIISFRYVELPLHRLANSAYCFFKSYDLERLAAQATGDYVTVAYRVRLTWVDKGGAEKPGGLRVIHTWLHNADHKWQIISGMAASPNAQGH